jgi:hypothetical protein
MKSKIMRLVGHVARMGETWKWWENLRETEYLEDPVVDRKIILRWIFRKWCVGT